MHEDPTDDADSALIERLQVIDQQPLRERAASYLVLHDELARDLEAPPASSDPS